MTPDKQTLNKARLLKRIAELYLYENRTQTDMAATLGVSRTTIGRYLGELRDAWQKSALMDFDEARKRELAKIEQLETEYWASWKQSLGGEEREANTSLADSEDCEQRRERQAAGNPRYLQGVQWCIDKRCEILGINAAKKVESGVQVTFSELVKGVYADHRAG
ncbi:MAG TPA: hypothetical protein PLP19_18335 [bacterium]|nr:hypothetical protein [bacterium]HPN45456.1 hypothetical protein [bacterium]